MLWQAAHSNGIYIAAADRVGIEREMAFPGRSFNCKEQREFQLQDRQTIQNKLYYVDCNFAKVRAHGTTKYNSTKKDRRLDVYDEFLGYDPSNFSNTV